MLAYAGTYTIDARAKMVGTTLIFRGTRLVQGRTGCGVTSWKGSALPLQQSLRLIRLRGRRLCGRWCGRNWSKCGGWAGPTARKRFHHRGHLSLTAPGAGGEHPSQQVLRTSRGWGGEERSYPSGLRIGVTRIWGARGRAALTLPELLAAGAGDRFRRVLLHEGAPANRTIFLPHSLHLRSSLQLGRSKSKLARASFAGPVNFEVSLGVRGRGD
jgi:hypothetical protein